MTARALPVLASALLAGCVSERTKAVPSIEGPVLGRPGDAGPAGDGGALSGGGRADRGSQAPPIEDRRRLAASISASRAASVPAAPTVPYAAHRPLPASVSFEDRARERFLAAETSISARVATVYAPERYAREASLRGASVEDAAGRRVAVGDAVLVLRRLTVRAASVTLVSRTDGKDDVQVSARGDVAFRSDQPASVIEETGLRGLLLRNDVHTPLR